MGAASGRDRGPDHAAPTWFTGSSGLENDQRRNWRRHLVSVSLMLTRWRKARLRKRALAARTAASKANRHAGQQLVDRFPDEIWPRVHQVVAGYAAIGDEIDPTPLLETFALEQARLALPSIIQKGEPLVFRSWALDQALTSGVFNVPEPDPSSPEVVPGLVLTPLVAFDLKGGRLGYGAGFYDRTLAKLERDGKPFQTVGLAFEAQRFAHIPTGAHDIALDWVVTEHSAYKTKA